MKKMTLLFVLIVVFLMSCTQITDLDKTLDGVAIKNQFIFWDTGTRIVRYKDNEIILNSIDIHDLFMCNDKGFYFSEYSNKTTTIYFYDFSTNEVVKYKELDYYVYCMTFDNNLIVSSGDGYYLMDFDNFEILEFVCTEKEKITDYYLLSIYTYGLEIYCNSLYEIEYMYNNKFYCFSINEIIDNCNVKLNVDRSKMTLGSLYRYKDELYISVNYKYRTFSRESLIFKIEDDGFEFIDYYHYPANSVRYIKYCGL